MTDGEKEHFIEEALIKRASGKNLRESEKIVLGLVDSGRNLTCEDVGLIVQFMDDEYERFKRGRLV